MTMVSFEMSYNNEYQSGVKRFFDQIVFNKEIAFTKTIVSLNEYLFIKSDHKVPERRNVIQ